MIDDQQQGLLRAERCDGVDDVLGFGSGRVGAPGDAVETALGTLFGAAPGRCLQGPGQGGDEGFTVSHRDGAQEAGRGQLVTEAARREARPG
ncbi:hypothetical protein WKI65_33290 [Streptomyces sp. MS1.AVA.3]|uniref:hypothetical protein n=1 Tax=Streptomyces decoyicus TaxID=249567 RepID=UPI0030C40AF3